jgi:hypothetical protein
MARFISILSGSNPNLANHDTRAISNGTTLRNGLIASRSALSTDIYAELFDINKNGARGVFFPVDLISTTAVAGQITGSVYTSSRAGIVIPSDYSIRPTASVLSTDAFSVVSNPLNRASASLVSYQSASKAVKDVLDSITGGGPYGRIGLNPSRTLHTIYYDPETRYFAWDDFTPGTPNPTGVTVQNLTYTDGMTSNNNVIYLESGTDTLRLTASWGVEFQADSLGTTTVNFTLADESTSDALFISAGTVNNAVRATYTIPANNFTRYSNTQGLIQATYQVRFSDVTIPSHISSLQTFPPTSLGVRPQILYRRTNARATGSFNASNFCSVSTTTIFTVNSEASSSRLYADKIGGIYQPPGVLSDQDYYVAFGDLDNSSQVFTYRTGLLQSTINTVTCTTGGGGTTTTTSTTSVQPVCEGSTYGTCPFGQECCEIPTQPGQYTCVAGNCSNA